ncbi:MAG: hypothetical protein IJV98_06255 [Clostridia bacterium]|nr:hypothetical protein [Clostridia bacterium]
MQFIPKKNKKGAIVSLCLMLLGGAGLIASVTAQIRYAALFQLAALFLFIFSFEFFYRYEMTTMIYLYDGQDFKIIRKVGKKEQYVCNLAMSTAIAILPTPTGREARRAMARDYGKIGIRYNHAQVMHPRCPYSVLFDFNGKVAEIVFEPDEKMAAAIAEQIRLLENQKN